MASSTRLLLRTWRSSQRPQQPSHQPSQQPSAEPSAEPAAEPAAEPSAEPSDETDDSADDAELERIKAFLFEKYGVQPHELQQLVDRNRKRGESNDAKESDAQSDAESDRSLEVTGFREGAGPYVAGAVRELAANRAAVLALGLPCFTVPYRSCESIPQTLYDQIFAEEPEPHVSFVARILDGWSGSRAFRKHLISWLEDLCFDFVDVDDERAQIGASCGYVAARGINLMFAAADSMMAVDLSDALNSVLQNGRDGAEYLETQRVYQLIEAFREHDCSPGKYLYTGTPIDEKIPFRPIPAPDPQYPHACMQWPVTVGSSDWVARKIAEAVMQYVNTQQQMWEQHLFVMNTQESGQQGSHWIAIGIEMKRV